METRLITIENSAAFAEAVDEAAAVLRSGGLAAVPTETVYGLAANALNPEAVSEIYRVKGRPSRNPVILHISSLEMARSCAAEWSSHAQVLARSFWPGPLTLVLPKSPSIPGIVTAGGPTAGIRWPAHPFMRALIDACAFPIAAPSANLSNEISSTTVGHVLDSLEGRIPLVVDAGPSPVGIESTVVDLSSGGWRVLRPGMIPAARIEELLGPPQAALPAGASALRSPGLLQKHYAPRALLRVLPWSNEADLLARARSFDIPFEHIHIIAHEHIPRSAVFGRVAVVPQDAEACARALYAELHACDAAGARLILFEQVPPGPDWDGIRDRLTRASAEN